MAADGERLWLADSETSALRWVDLDGAVHTAVGTGPFDFGHRDGPAEQAPLQHPSGVTALPDGSLAVSDTHNHALRHYDPRTGEVSTLATDLREPGDAVLAGADIVVVESARHRLTRLRPPRRAATEVTPGRLRLDVIFRAPAGQKQGRRGCGNRPVPHPRTGPRDRAGGPAHLGHGRVLRHGARRPATAGAAPA